MKNKPKITALVTSFNQESTIKDSILSLVDQDLAEILVIDDASTDKSLKLITSLQRKYSKIKLIALKSNSGVSHCLNTGIESSKSQFVLLQGADDVAYPERAEIHRKQVRDYPNFFAYLARPHNPLISAAKHETAIDHSEFLIFKSGRLTPDRLFINENKLCAPTAIIDKTKLGSIIFNENLIQLQDFWLWIKLAWKEKLFLSDDSIVYYGVGKRETLSSLVANSDTINYKRYEVEIDWIYRNFFWRQTINKVLNYFPSTNIAKSYNLNIKDHFLVLKSQYYLAHPRVNVRRIGLNILFDLIEKRSYDFNFLLDLYKIQFSELKNLDILRS